MAESDVGIKLVAEDSSFKTAMANANQLIKQMAQEAKEAASGIGDLGTKQEAYSHILDAQKQKLELLNKQHEESSNKLKSLAEAYEKAKEAGDSEAISKAADAYAKQATEISKLETQMSACRTAINETTQEMDKSSDSMNEADTEAEDLDQTLDDLNESAQSTGGGFDAMTVAIGNMIAEGIRMAVSAIKDFVAETVNIGIEFDRSMSQVQATSGATQEEIDQLSNKAKEMGENTKFSASESAEAFNYMAMAGWDANDMLNGINGVLALAAAGNTDLATTSDIVTDSLTAFGQSADQAGRLADIMAAASSNANTNVQMMGETFKYAAPVAGALGYSMEDVAVAVGLMANAGIKGSQAGTSLRSALTNLANPTESMEGMMVKLGLAVREYGNAVDQEKLKAAQDNLQKKLITLEQAQIKFNAAVEKYGADSSQAQIALGNVEKATIGVQQAQEKLRTEQEGSIETSKLVNQLIEDSDGNMRSFSDVLVLLREKFAGLDEAEKAQAAATLFGKEAMSGMLAILNASEEDFLKLKEAIDNSAGSAEEMAETMQDNLGGDLDEFHSKLESVQLHLYEKFEPVLREIVQALTDMLDGLKGIIDGAADFIEWLNSGSAEAELLKTAIIAVTTALGAFAVALGIHALITKVQAAFVALNAVMMANPIALVVAAIAGLVAAFVTLWNKSEAFRNFFINLWEGIKSALGPIVEGIVQGFKDAWEGIQQAWANVKEWFGEKWEGIKSAFVDVGDWFKEKFDGARNWVNKAFEDVGTWFGDRRKDVENAWETVDTWLKDKMDKGREWTEQAFKDIGDWFGDRRKDVENAWETVDKWMGEKYGDAWDGIKGAFDPFVNFFTGIWEEVKKVYSVVAKVFTGDFQGAWDGVTGIWDDAMGFFSGVWKDITGVFSNAFETFKEIGKNLIEGIKKGIKDKWESFKSWVSNLWHSIIGDTEKTFEVNSPSKVMARIGGYVVEGFANGMKAKAGLIDKAADRVFGDVSNLAYVANGGSYASGSVVSAGGSASAQAAAQPIYLQIDGKTFARIATPYIDSQQGRNWSRQVALGVSV